MNKNLCSPKRQILLLLAVFFMHGIFAQPISYVNANLTTGSNNGTTWADAYKDLQPALAAAQNGDQIWVAKGIYYPTTSTTDRTASFVMKNNVGIYGGFAGNETVLGQRDWTNNVTTLSGDIDHATDPLAMTGTGSGYTLIITGNTGNSYNVVKNNKGGPNDIPLNNTAILDGLTISGGNANNVIVGNGLGSMIQGGGMYNSSSSPSLANLVFSGNSAVTSAYSNGYLTGFGNGGGMFNTASSPVLTNCTFLNNNSFDGAGVYNLNSSSPILTNCVFFGNNAAVVINSYLTILGGTGGGMLNSTSCSPALVNCLFSKNNSIYGGAGMANSNSAPSLTNCIFFNNLDVWGSGGSGGGMLNTSSTSNLVNCVFFNNASEVGGGICNYISTTNLTNCTFFGNFTGNPNPSGGGIDNEVQSITTIKNSVIWGNTPNGITNKGITSVSYSNVQGTGNYTGTGNINQDPLFVNTSNPTSYNSFSVTTAGLALQPASPCINTGSNAAIPTGITIDIAGLTRIIGGTVDMGAYEAQSNVLPLQLLSFIGKRQSGNNLLQWKTTKEIGTKNFEVACSANGITFSPIGNVMATGGGEYFFTDNSPISNHTYYRLKMIDADGKFAYSAIIWLNTTAINYISVYPNPVTQTATLDIGDNLALIGTQALLTDANGRLVKKTTIKSSQQQLDMTLLPAGIYVLKLEEGGIAKLIKQ